MDHAPFIHCCLALAEKGRGFVGINPLVGSVLVRNGKIIAEAFHEGFGLAHAERKLLEDFEGTIESDDVLYINLEPCCHHGKTPPCTGLIIEKGVKHVVYGMKDPNPGVAGKGIEALRNAGVEVLGPVAPELCKRLNRGFISLQTSGRPYITLKRAQTSSGEISQPDGSPLKITSREQDEWAHTHLRAKYDAILVGVGTILKDDPALTVRFGAEEFQPLRIVLDPNLGISLDAKVIGEGTVIIKGTSEKRIIAEPEQAFPPAWAEELSKRGAKLEEIPLKNGVFNWEVLWKVLTTPQGTFCGITSILVEGGAGTWKHFREAGMIDEEVVLIGN